MKLTEETEREWQKYVLSEYPKEAVAYVIGNRLYRVTNAAEDPYHTFAITDLDQFKARVTGSIQALLHSHPYKIEDSQTFSYPPEWPSEPDMTGWINDTIPWGIVATDGEGLSAMIWMDDTNPEPLEGRMFIHGVNDCYSVVRDWFRQEKGITLLNIPRSMEWWLKEDNLYEDNFRRAGFVVIKEEEAGVGDCVLMALHGDKISHAAVITGPNQILHHIMSRNGNRLSGYDSWSKWHRQIIKYVRYVGEKDDS